MNTTAIIAGVAEESARWIPFVPSVDALRWLGRYRAAPGKPFPCPVCATGEAVVTHKHMEWPEFLCSACKPGTTVKDLLKIWPLKEGDCSQSMQQKPGVIIPGDPGFTPAVSVIPLGYDENNNYYYQNSLTGHILPLKPQQHKEDFLCGITPDISYWLWSYGGGGEGKVDWKLAGRDLMAKCQIRGRFQIDDVRGAGVWIDRGRVVANLGTHLLVDGVDVPSMGFDSEYMYDAMIKAVKLPDPASLEQTRKYVGLLKRLPFEDSTGPIALGGMTVIGMLSGILSWRPHLWLTGGAESGKSSILTHTLHEIWKPIGAIIADESTSAAGIRQRLRQSAVPVVLDESESDDQAGLSRVKSIVKMARSASSDTNASVYKGTVGGTNLEYKVRSCFVLCSIVESLATIQDRQRFVVVQCRKTAASTQNWPDLKYDLKQSVTQEFGLALYAGVIRDANVILKNIDTASRKVFKILGGDSRRYADQIGSLIAGYHYLQHQGVVLTEDAAGMFYYSMNHTEISNDISKEEDTALRCLNQIFSYRPHGEQRTIGEFALEVANTYRDGHEGVGGWGGEKIEIAKSALRRIGLDVERWKDGKPRLIVAAKHPELIDLLERRGYTSHSKLLRRIPGCVSYKTKSFAGVSSHSISVPVDWWLEDLPPERGTVSTEELMREIDGRGGVAEEEDY